MATGWGATVYSAAMLLTLSLSTLLVAITVTVHFFGLLALVWMMRVPGRTLAASRSVFRRGALILAVVLGLFVVHTVEIWIYAAFYDSVGAVRGFEPSLYFSTVSFVAIGYGDIVLDEKWRLIGAIEGANGLILMGWSTAFLLSVMTRMRALEHDWLEADDKPRG
jgi:hypothetical protein